MKKTHMRTYVHTHTHIHPNTHTHTHMRALAYTHLKLHSHFGSKATHNLLGQFSQNLLICISFRPWLALLSTCHIFIFAHLQTDTQSPTLPGFIVYNEDNISQTILVYAMQS